MSIRNKREQAEKLGMVVRKNEMLKNVILGGLQVLLVTTPKKCNGKREKRQTGDQNISGGKNINEPKTTVL